MPFKRSKNISLRTKLLEKTIFTASQDRHFVLSRVLRTNWDEWPGTLPWLVLVSEGTLVWTPTSNSKPMRPWTIRTGHQFNAPSKNIETGKHSHMDGGALPYSPRDPRLTQPPVLSEWSLHALCATAGIPTKCCHFFPHPKDLFVGKLIGHSLLTSVYRWMVESSSIDGSVEIEWD